MILPHNGTCVIWIPWDQLSILIIKVSRFSRSAYVLKGYFGTTTKCVDHAGVLIFKYPLYVTGSSAYRNLGKISHLIIFICSECATIKIKHDIFLPLNKYGKKDGVFNFRRCTPLTKII